MNRLILKDGRGAVETVPTSKGIATLDDQILHNNLNIVETVPTSKGIATRVFERPSLRPVCKVETVPTSKGIATMRVSNTRLKSLI